MSSNTRSGIKMSALIERTMGGHSTAAGQTSRGERKQMPSRDGAGFRASLATRAVDADDDTRRQILGGDTERRVAWSPCCGSDGCKREAAVSTGARATSWLRGDMLGTALPKGVTLA